jgi:dTDP-4-amino-4,6-dideoxygalactose transaminase
MRSGHFILGSECAAFEEEFASYSNVKHCIGVANGLDALTLTLRAMEIGPGQEVLVPAHTFIATWMAVSAAGATPVPVDVDQRTFNIAPHMVEAAITPRTAAIIPVHLYGAPADMTPIRHIAQRRGLRIIEDAAQAHGATYDGVKAGKLGDAACFSFYPAKNLGCLGDGGGVLTDDDIIAARVRKLRNYGSVTKYSHEMLGFNSRLDEMQAAFLRVKLSRLDEWNERRNSIADRYHNELAGLPGLKLPVVRPGSKHAWHLYVVRHPQRDQLQEMLRVRNVQTLVHYPTPPHKTQAYADKPLPAIMKNSEELASTILSLPIGPHQTSTQTDAVITAVRHAVVELSRS